MKISKIYISAFGGLKDTTLELGDGLNVIFGENEQGKTTVMSFIRAMFYGTGKKTQSLENSLRVKYTPLDGSPMGGRIWFEQNGKEYCLERIFNKSDSTDKTTLTDLTTGEKTPVTNEIGSRIFGIGGEAFRKSFFISGERNSEVDEVANGDLNARLSAVALTGSEDTSFQKIEKRITTAKEKVLSRTERAGTLAVLRKQRSELEELYEKAKTDAKRKFELNSLIGETEEKIGELSKKARAIKRLLSKKEDIKNAEKLKEYLDCKEKLDELNADLMTPGGSIIDAAFISKIRFCKAKLLPKTELIDRLKGELEGLEEAEKMAGSLSVEEAQKKYDELKEDVVSFENEKAKIENEIAENEKKLDTANQNATQAEKVKKPLNLLLLTIGIAMIAGGILCGLVLVKAYYAIAAVGVIAAISAFLLRPVDKAAAIKIKTEIAEIKEGIAALKTKDSEISSKIVSKTAEINSLVAVLTADKTVREKRLSDIAAKRAEIEEETLKEKELFTEYEKALDGIDDSEENLETTEKKAEQQKNLKLRLNYLSKDLGGISYDEAREKLKTADSGEDFSNIDFERAEEEFERLSNRILEENRLKTGYDTELKTSFRDSLQPEIIEREIKELDEKIAAFEDFVDGCEICLQVLSESFSNIRKGYGSELNERTLENFKRLTDGKYKTVSVDRSLRMEVERADSFGMFETGYLSTGTEDQAFLALRLAMCEMMGDKESHPVFLDDALSNYDDRRTAVAVRFLKDYSERSQVILFTCHGKVSEIAEKEGSAVKSLLPSDN